MKWFAIGIGVLFAAGGSMRGGGSHYERWMDVDA